MKKHLFVSESEVATENEVWTERAKKISSEVENFFDLIISKNPDIYRRDLGYIFHDAAISSVCKAIVFETSKRRKEKK